MAGVKISALPPVAAALATDIFPIVQGGVTSQVSLAQVQTLFGFPGGVLGMGQGGTGAVLVPDNGAIVYSTATSLALLAHTTTANQVLLSGASSAPSWSLATYPASTTANELLFSSAANTITGLATANNATLITSLTGVPSLSQILPSAVQTNITRLGAQAIDLNMNSHFIHNVTDPIQPQDAATKAYADLIASGLNVLLAVYAASTVNLTATYFVGVSGIGATLTNSGTLAAFAIDGVSPPVNSRILIKNQTSTLQNGIYTLTTVGSGAVAWVLTRATDYDQPAEITPGDLVIVNNGTVNIQTSWVETATVATVGVDPILFSQFTTTASGTVASGLINQLAYYAASGTTVSGLTGANSANLVTSPTGVPTWLGPMTNGQVVIGSTGVIPVLAALTAGAGITVTNGAGSISIAATAASTAFTQVKTIVFGTSATYTPTVGMKYCIVEAIGGGGAGGGTLVAAAGQGSAGGGGGSGAYSKNLFNAASIGASQSITVGAAGAGVAGGAGGSGGSSSFGTMTAPGGGGAAAAGSITGTQGFPGGAAGPAGTGGQINAKGSPGGSAIITGTTSCVSGLGASSAIGGGANAAFATGLVTGGIIGQTGSGGGGSGSAIQGVLGIAAAGGNGGSGVVIVTEFI